MPRPAEPPTRVLILDRTRWMMYANVAIKVGLVLAFLVAIIVEPPGAQGKGMEFRAPMFIGSAVLVPVIAIRRRWNPFPHTADALLAAPFLLDTVANVAGFYERYNATDDVLHILNWVLLVSAFHAFRFRNVHTRNEAIFIGYGFGGLAIIWWEIFEWLVSTEGFGGPNGLALTYSDTVGDLLLSSTGGLIGSIASVYLLGPVAGVGDRQTGHGQGKTGRGVERAMGIEPTSSAWKAEVLAVELRPHEADGHGE